MNRPLFFIPALALLLAACALLPSSARATNVKGANGAQPVIISAAGNLVWNRTAHTYTMKKDAEAKQGTMKINADTLTARYTDDKKATDITTLEAAGHVVLQSPPYTAYGDRATYDLETKKAEMTGSNLRIVTPAETLTAKDKITFDAALNKMTALGGATATRGVDKMTADVMSAFFAKDANGKLAVDKMTANGNVVIVTQKETVYGDKGVYDIPAQKAVLTGKVRIMQGNNWLEGTRADVDLKTGISQLFADNNPATQNRVYGVFYPKTQSPDQGAGKQAAQP